MHVICAWCLEVIQEGDEQWTSHGICEACSDVLDTEEVEAALEGVQEKD
jgi:hypothetical protein